MAHLGLSQAEDEALLKVASTQKRLFITRDRDFGHLVFVKRLGAGVLYLRILPSTLQVTHDELNKVLKRYSEETLSNAFVVVEPDGHRIRKLST